MLPTLAVLPLSADLGPRLLADPDAYREAWNLPAEHPGPAQLEALEAEARRALVPCTPKEALAAAAVLLDAWPQADKTTATYARMIAERLAGCPSDLLAQVVNRVVDGSPSFRPGPGEVRKAVSLATLPRRQLLARIQAAQAWFAGAEKRRAEAERIRAERAAAAARVAAAGYPVRVATLLAKPAKNAG